MRISDWSSDVCSSDLAILAFGWAAWAPASAMRRFGMDAAEIGPLFAVVLIAANLPGFLCSGWICDRWFAKGRTDAHLRYYVYTLGFAVAVAAIGFQFAPSVGPFLLAYAIGAFFLPFTGPAGGQDRKSTRLNSSNKCA